MPLRIPFLQSWCVSIMCSSLQFSTVSATGGHFLTKPSSLGKSPLVSKMSWWISGSVRNLEGSCICGYVYHTWMVWRTKKHATVGRCKDPTIDHVQNHGAKKRPFSGICWSIFCSQELFTKKNNLETWSISIPSMHGTFTRIWLIFLVSVGKYTIHGCQGSLTLLSGTGGSCAYQKNMAGTCWPQISLLKLLKLMPFQNLDLHKILGWWWFTMDHGTK